MNGLLLSVRCAVAILLPFALGCGPGVYSALDPGPPLVTLRAEVVNAMPPGAPSSGLKAAVLWAALPAEVESCLGAAVTVEQMVACAGRQFRPHLTTMTVPVEPAFPAAFELPVHEAPALGALSPSRFGYGLVAVLHDGNANGQLDLVAPDAADGPDWVLGTSLRGDSNIVGDYLAYREGDVPPTWNAFRLLADCPEPPRGFFIIRLTQQGNQLSCALDPAESPFRLELASSARAHACRHAPPPTAQPPPETPPPAGSALQCWGQGSLEVVERPDATCRRVLRYDLLNQTAPPWWSCAAAPSFIIGLTRAAAPLTPGYDRLFSLHFEEGPGAFKLVDLRVRVGGYTLSTIDSEVAVGRPTFTLVDRNGDARFSRGDTVDVDEGEPSQFSSTSAGPLPVEVWAESEGRVVTLGSTLSWQP